MANGPTVKFWQVTSVGTGQVNQVGTGNASLISGTNFNFGDVEAGMWSVPQVLLIEFDGSTARQLLLADYQTGQGGDGSQPRAWPIIDSTDEDLFEPNYSAQDPTLWHFRICLMQNWTDPTTISTVPGNSPMDTIGTTPGSWQDLLWSGSGGSPFSIDGGMLPTGNDGSANLLTPMVTGGTGNYVTNFFIYIASKPRTMANAGPHTSFGFRLTYIYP